MSCRLQAAGALAYRYCPGDPPVASERVRALFRARLIDEITQQPVEVDVTATTDVSGAATRVAPFGRVGLVGRPLRLFPDLGSTPVDLDLHVIAAGYLPVDLTKPLGPIIGFPEQFAPTDLGDVALHRIAVALRGRTIRRGSLASTVVGGATVTVAGYWPVFPPASVAPAAAMLSPNFACISPGLYAPRADAAATLKRQPMAALAGEDKALLSSAPRGARRVRLSNRTGLLAGTVLILSPNDPGRRERIPVDQVDVSSSQDQPAWVTLAHPLAHPHLVDAVCSVAALQLPMAANTLTRAAIPGDESVFLDGMTGLVNGAVVEISGGGGPPEYHEVSLYQATSDAEGYFRLPPMARVAMVLLHAQRVGLTSPDDARVAPDYRVAENRITVMFP